MLNKERLFTYNKLKLRIFTMMKIKRIIFLLNNLFLYKIIDCY